ncbi:MAG: murein L,D-transpeptidase catalytic domain family protein [Bdellovibrionales bacterium]
MSIRIFWQLCLFLSLTAGATSTFAQSVTRLRDLPDAEGTDRPSDLEIKAAKEEIARRFPLQTLRLNKAQRRAVLNRYAHLDPEGRVPSDLLEEAVVYFDRNKSGFDNQDYISVVDFAPRSNHARLFVIDMNSGRVHEFHTTHGQGSDVDNDGYAESFGNVPGSYKSSLGFYRVAEVYYGKYGRSIRLDGLSATNSKVRARAIVVHGSDYVHESNVVQGRSNGCFALAWSVKDDIVDLIHGGSLLYAHVSGG